MKKAWHKSLNFDLSLYKRDTEEGDRLQWQRAGCWLPHLPFRSLCGVSPPETMKAKRNFLVAFKAFIQLQKSGYLKSGIQIYLRQHPEHTRHLHRKFWPWSIYAQVSGKQWWPWWSLPRKWFQLFKQEAPTAIGPLELCMKDDVTLSRCYAKP